MTEFDPVWSIHTRLAWVAVLEVASADGKVFGRERLATYFPSYHQPLLDLALKDLADSGVIQRNGDRIKLLASNGNDLVREFSDWWQMYPGPRRIKRVKCQAKYIRLRKGGVSQAEMFEGLERWRQCDDWKKDNGRYIMAPEVWLNGGCWGDYPGGAPQPEPEPPAGFDAPWLQDYSRFVADLEHPRAWELSNYAMHLGIPGSASELWRVYQAQGSRMAAAYGWSLAGR